MIPKDLSILERQMLSNQFHILAGLTDDEYVADDYKKKAEIIEYGYEGEYSNVFTGIWRETFSSEQEHEMFEILEMFRKIKWGLQALNDNQRSQLDTEKLSFQGFDGSHDPHFSFLVWWDEHHPTNSYREDLGAIAGFNSHSSTTIDTYRNLLDVFSTFDFRGKPRVMTFDELQLLNET